MRPKAMEIINTMITGNYDYIKWLIAQIKGVEWIYNHYDSSSITLKRGAHIDTYYLHSRSFRLETYPYLLTRAIEGINETDPWKIDIFYVEPTGWSWSYKDYISKDEHYEDADRAKEDALLYVKRISNPVDKNTLLTEIEEDIKECTALMSEFNKGKPGTAVYIRFTEYIEDSKKFLLTGDLEKFQLIKISLNNIKRYFNER